MDDRTTSSGVARFLATIADTFMRRSLRRRASRVDDKRDPRRFLLDLLPRESIGAEIGVHKGDFSRRILDLVRPRELHLIDPWRHEPSATYKDAWYGGHACGQAEMDTRYVGVCARFATEIRSGTVIVHRGNSSDVLERFGDEYFDWVYIDGNHLYAFVLKDLQLSTSKTATGGYIAGDDYSSPGWWRDGVRRAVDEFIEGRVVQLVDIRNGQFVLRK